MALSESEDGVLAVSTSMLRILFIGFIIEYSSTAKIEASGQRLATDHVAPTMKTNSMNCSIFKLSVYMCSSCVAV